MTMTRSTPDQLIKIIVAALKLSNEGRVACGEWKVASAELTCIHSLCDMRVLHKLSANYVADALCFPDFPQQQPCQRNLSRANNKRNSSGASIEGQRDGEGKEVAALVCVAQALPLLS